MDSTPKLRDSTHQHSVIDYFVSDRRGGWPDRFGRNLAAWSSQILKKPIRTLSLFSGAGGLDIAFHQAGFNIVEMVEYDERFISTLEANSASGRLFEHSRPLCQDVRDYAPPVDHRIDFVIGGPPCQSFSAAGRRAGGVSGATDSRGRLFEAYVDILRAVRPVGFLFENVYGITGANNGRDWAAIQSAFSDAGYSLFTRILDAADYGVPQHRERMFILGVREGAYRFPRPTHGPDSPTQEAYFGAHTAVEGAPVSDHEQQATVNGRYGGLLAEIPPGLNYSFFTAKMGHPRPLFAWRSKFSDFLYKADPDRPVRTLKAQGGQYTGPFHWNNRPFGIAEFKRLQTFPDDYELTGGKSAAIHQIGNSVPPQMARILALSILQQIFDVSPPTPLPLLEDTESLGFRSRKRALTKHYASVAQRALQDHKSHSVPRRVRSKSYLAVLSNEFTWMRARGDCPDALRAEFHPTRDQWRFRVSENPVSEDDAFTIWVQPAMGSAWPIPTTEVILSGERLTRGIFTGAWKAFEAELAAHGIKADLVQLCGYYQYAPSIASQMQFHGRRNQFWRVVAEVVSGNGVRETLPTTVVANRWRIDESRVWDAAHFLRTLGFEVRNSNTNPQIPKDSLLIPYAFPTLTQKSVQLRKVLA